jgi:hypothetical protein
MTTIPKPPAAAVWMISSNHSFTAPSMESYEHAFIP